MASNSVLTTSSDNLLAWLPFSPKVAEQLNTRPHAGKVQGANIIPNIFFFKKIILHGGLEF